MALYKYHVRVKDREDFTESGTVVAKSELEAKGKLNRLDFNNPHLKKITGWAAFIGQFSADVR